MALDLKKKMAFAGKDQPDKGGGGKGGKAPPFGKKKGGGDDKHAKGDEHDDEHDEGDEGDDDYEEGGEGKFGALIPLLEQHHEDIDACCDEVDPDILTELGEELPEDDHASLMEAFNGLDGKLKKAMKSLVGITSAQADKLADHLHDEDMIDDPDRFAGLLVRFGQVLA